MANVIRRSVSESMVAAAARASRVQEENFRQEKENMREGLVADNASPGRRSQVWQQFNVWGVDKTLIIQRDTRNRMLQSLARQRGSLA